MSLVSSKDYASQDMYYLSKIQSKTQFEGFDRTAIAFMLDLLPYLRQNTANSHKSIGTMNCELFNRQSGDFRDLSMQAPRGEGGESSPRV
jgi:hypothetical protein